MLSKKAWQTVVCLEDSGSAKILWKNNSLFLKKLAVKHLV